MSHSREHFRLFLRAVHRRLVVLRIIESVGGGVAAGCAIALPLVIMQVWRGMPAWPVAILMMLVGAAGGLVLAIRNWPTRLYAAHEADVQLGLTDLLTTALSMQGLQQDPWVQSIFAMAEARCRTLSPSEVVLHRLGLRAWGGIGIFAAMVLAVSLLGTEPNPSLARGQSSSTDDSVEASSLKDAPSANASGTKPLAGADRADPLTSNDSPEFAESRQSSDLGSSSAGNASPAEGARVGMTKSAHVPSIPPSAHKGSTDPSSATGQIGRGAGALVPTMTSTTPPSEGEGFPDFSRQTPPWQTDAWHQSAKNALQQVRDESIPPAYRDLVRDYFSREE